MIVDPC